MSEILTIFGLILSWILWRLDVRFQRSSLYLKYAENYFERASSILGQAENNNVRWHQVMDALSAADSVRFKITDKSHRSIYMREFINTGNNVLYCLDKVDDYRFFYGCSDYKEKTPETLYNECAVKSDKYIEPEELKKISAFVSKANKMAVDIKNNNPSASEIFQRNYFKKSIKSGTSEDVERPGVKRPYQRTIEAYIEHYQKEAANAESLH